MIMTHVHLVYSPILCTSSDIKIDVEYGISVIPVENVPRSFPDIIDVFRPAKLGANIDLQINYTDSSPYTSSRTSLYSITGCLS